MKHVGKLFCNIFCKGINFILSAVVVVCLVGVICLNLFFQPVIVTGMSMSPTYLDKDALISCKSAYKNNMPERNDVVVVDGSHYDLDVNIIKRVVAVGGDTVCIKNGYVYVNNDKIEDSYDRIEKNMKTVTVPEYCVFVLGDNRNNSKDSRVFGCVNIDDILGKIVYDAQWLKDIGHVFF